MQDFFFSLMVFFQTVVTTMAVIVFGAILSSIIFLVVKSYARRGVRDAKQKNWASAKRALIMSFSALVVLAVLQVIGFFEWLFHVLFGG